MEKLTAAKRALELVREYKLVGVGSGSTVEKWIEMACRDVDFREKTYVSSSLDTTLKLRANGLKVLDLTSVREVEVYVDGADEVDRSLNMIKGGGGAMLREKVLAELSNYNVIIVDSRKLVERLGTRSPLPLEVVPASLPLVEKNLENMGLRWTLRSLKKGKLGPVISDNGNFIVDVHFENGILDPRATYEDLKLIPGVAEVGLFLDLADIVIVGRNSGVEELKKQ